jgi:hypothetical protein
MLLAGEWDTSSICAIVFRAELESVVLPTDCEFPCSAINAGYSDQWSPHEKTSINSM